MDDLENVVELLNSIDSKLFHIDDASIYLAGEELGTLVGFEGKTWGRPLVFRFQGRDKRGRTTGSN